MSGRDAIQDFSDEKSKAKPWGFWLSVIGYWGNAFAFQFSVNGEAEGFGYRLSGKRGFRGKEKCEGKKNGVAGKEKWGKKNGVASKHLTFDSWRVPAGGRHSRGPAGGSNLNI